MDPPRAQRSLKDQMNSTSELLARLKGDRSSIMDSSMESSDDRAQVRPSVGPAHAHARTPSRSRTFSLNSQQSAGNRSSIYVPHSQHNSLEPLTYQRDAERQLLAAMQTAKHQLPGDLLIVLLQRVVAQTIGLYDGAEAPDIDALCVLLCDMLRAYQDKEAIQASPHYSYEARRPEFGEQPISPLREIQSPILRSESRLKSASSLGYSSFTPTPAPPVPQASQALHAPVSSRPSSHKNSESAAAKAARLKAVIDRLQRK